MTERLMDRTTNIFLAGVKLKFPICIYPTHTVQDARNLAQDARNLVQDAGNLVQDASNLSQDARTTVSVS